MILLMSEYKDNSTIYISRWLLHWQVPFIRIDGQEKYILEQIALENGKRDMLLRAAKDKSKSIKMSDVKAVWYRRGELNFVIPDLSFIQEPRLQQTVKAYLESENLTLEYYFYYLMASKPHIGTFFTRTVNKLEVLHEAAELGITIPTTLVANSSIDLNSSRRFDLTSMTFFTAGTCPRSHVARSRERDLTDPQHPRPLFAI